MTEGPCGKTMGEERSRSVPEGDSPRGNTMPTATVLDDSAPHVRSNAANQLGSFFSHREKQTCDDFPKPDTMAADSTPHARSNAANQAGSFFSPMKMPLSYIEQCEKLIGRGLSVNAGDTQAIINSLKNDNYYRLSGYWISFLEKDNSTRFAENTTMDNILDISQADSDLRMLAFRVIEPIELKFRGVIAYVLSMEYGPDAMANPEIFADMAKYERALKTLARETQHAVKQRTPWVLHNLEKYGQLPLWALVEITSLGTLSKLYGNLASKGIREAIAGEFGVSSRYLKSWVEYLTQVRNICAHHNRLYNRYMIKTPALHKANKGFDHRKEFPIFLVAACLLSSIDEVLAYRMIDELQELIMRHEAVSLKDMGFPPNWKDILLRNCERSHRA